MPRPTVLLPRVSVLALLAVLLLVGVPPVAQGGPAHSASEQGATTVVTSCLASYSWANPVPDIAVLVMDELVVFPWDRRVLIDGRWQVHPELAAALAAQVKGAPPETDLLHGGARLRGDTPARRRGG